MSWQPIETAPKNGVHLLLTDEMGAVCIGHHMTGKYWRTVSPEGVCDDWNAPTHWMPLPEPPRLPVDEETDK